MRDASLRHRLADALDEIAAAPSLRDLTVDCKKMKGYQNLYRIRLGDYRAGFQLKDDEVIFVHFRHRKRIYRVFP